VLELRLQLFLQHGALQRSQNSAQTIPEKPTPEPQTHLLRIQLILIEIPAAIASQIIPPLTQQRARALTHTTLKCGANLTVCVA
jgi:hypothetical protein